VLYWLKKFCLAALPLILTASVSGCSRRSVSYEIQLPVTAPLSRSVIGYGVIASSYTHVLDRRDINGEPLGLLRKGSIVEILERRPVVQNNKAESWVFVSGTYTGWLREDELNVYDYRAQAETAAGNIRQ
jgi:hypothetical protein